MNIAIKAGVCHVDGQPTLLVSADYPYYRDDPANWPDRLQKLRDECHIKVISTYVPWRYHQPDSKQAPDFSGVSQPGRDVGKFLGLCHSLGLWVIIKPGPFIHAELNYGGLPDWVCPLYNPAIEPLCGADGQPCRWPGSEWSGPDATELAEWPLPAPFSPPFLQLTTGWLEAVSSVVIKPALYPTGPIIMTQIANEGLYSNGQQAPWSYDYSPSALALFRDFLTKKYKSLASYNELHNTGYSECRMILPPQKGQIETLDKFRRTLAYADWSEFQAYYMKKVYEVWGGALKLDIPLLVNLNPPLATDYGLDAWLSRVVPEDWPNVHYGYTNWIGNVASDPSAFDRYLLLTKRAPGLNLEENWGFSILYDPSYIDASTSYYQTLLALAGGATGFNVYTGVGTAHWDEKLDRLHTPPYPDCSPISETGAVTPKATIVGWLSEFLTANGSEFLNCKPRTQVAWGLYLPQPRLHTWLSDTAALKSLTLLHGQALGYFQSQMRALRQEYGLVELQTVEFEKLLTYPNLVVWGGAVMERRVQEKLDRYVRWGGNLRVLGELPYLDENFEPLGLLHELAFNISQVEASSPDYGGWLGENSDLQITDGQGDVFIRSDVTRDVHYLIALIPSTASSTLSFSCKLSGVTHQLRLEATPGGGAIIRIEQGRLSDLIVKGINNYLGQRLIPSCSLDGVDVGLDWPGDFMRLSGRLKAQYAPLVSKL